MTPSHPADPFAGVSAPLLRAGTFGLEREALRVTPAGDLALTPHPAAFGDKLQNRRITVDFSESQLELITPPQPSVDTAWRELASLHDEVEAVLDACGERLWPLSMPPALPPEDEIPIARFGPTEAGRRNELYRTGLGHRYGRARQMISGIHFSFSFPPALLAAALGGRRHLTPVELADEAYFRVARNVLRDRWLLIYLTGASPVADPTFHRVLGQHVHAVRRCCPGCCAGPGDLDRHAISLRTSRHGYADTIVSGPPVSFDDRNRYVADLQRLLRERSDRFARLGLFRHGEPIQLNDRVLQRDSEFYAPIRLKGRLSAGGSHLEAIARDGVHYAEVRVLDLDPYVREGITLSTLRFLHVFLLDALAGNPAPLSADEWEIARENHHQVALSGRRPDLILRTLERHGPAREIAAPVFGRLTALAARMDDGLASHPFTEAVALQHQRLFDPDELPAARLAAAMARRGLTHSDYGARLLAPVTPAFAVA